MSGNREKLQQAALDSVQRSGLKSLSFRALANEVGIKSSSVHYHFPEKSDLAKKLIEGYSEEFFLTLKVIDNKNWTLRKKIKAFIDIFENVSEQNKLCLCGMMASEVDQLDDENRKLLSNYFVETENWLTRLFNDNLNDLQTDLSPRALARSLLAALEGALLVDRVVGDTHRLKAQRALFMAQIA